MPKATSTTGSVSRNTVLSDAYAGVNTVPASISLSTEDAEQIYELFKSVEAADSHFHTCQSVNFRDYIKAVYKAPKVSAAFAGLKQKISAPKEV